MNAKTFLLLVLCLFSVAFVFLGLYDRNVVLNANPCKMTYTSKDKSLIKLEFSTSFKLWKISNPKSNKMNPQPVLFVPGHFGRFCSNTFICCSNLLSLLVWIKSGLLHLICTTAKITFNTFLSIFMENRLHFMVVMFFHRQHLQTKH